MDSDIEIWDLDTVDGLYPAAILGASSAPPTDTNGSTADANGTSASTSQKKKKKKKRSKKPNPHYHVDAVLSLAANPHRPTLLASASADATVKLWDLTTTTCAHSYAFHAGKACSLAWHPTDAPRLLSGSYDQSIVVADVRAPAAPVPRWRVDADVDTVRWDPHAPERFFATTEAGAVYCFDARTAPPGSSAAESPPLWKLQAHAAAVSAFAASKHVPGLLATGSLDRSVKLWRTDRAAAGPTRVASRAMGLGKVFGLGFAPDEETAFRLAVGGSKGVVRVWDTSTNRAVRAAYTGKGLKSREGEMEGEERVVGVRADSSESESEEEGGDGAGYEDDEMDEG